MVGRHRRIVERGPQQSMVYAVRRIPGDWRTAPVLPTWGAGKPAGKGLCADWEALLV